VILRPTFRVLNATGELRCGYQLAARFAEGTLLRSTEFVGDSSATLEARILYANSYWFAQRPLDVLLWIGRGRWTWHAVSAIDVTGDRLHVQVDGSPEFFE
jgi:hypothetical protein